MKLLIVTGNPKTDGLCQKITDAVKDGAESAGAAVSVLYPGALERCHVCGEGWGTCVKTHTCAFGKDGFDAAQAQVREADALVLITPVYWEETSEALKGFLDRLRRCEFGGAGALTGKQTLLIASPGGSGNGAIGALTQMDRFCRHTGAVIFDYISVNRWNSDYKREAAFAAAKAIASGRKNGDTIIINN